MKRFLSIFFVCLLAFVAFACGEDPVEYSLSIADADKNVALVEGDEKTIVPTVAGGATLVWSSNAPEVASVAEGVITALKEGTAVITVSLKEDETLKVEISVTVSKKEVIVETKEYTVTFSDGVASQKVKEGEKATKPADPTKEGFIFKGWFVGETAYDFNSAVTGDLTLTAKWEEEEPEVILVEEIDVDYDFEALNIGQSEELVLDVWPYEAKQEVEWVIEPADCVSISEDNKITALKGGLVTIYAKATDGSDVQSTPVQFRVFNDAEDFSITGVNKMSAGETQTLKVEIVTEYTQSTFTWSSSDENVATVNANGFVTAVADGAVTITAKSNDSTGVSKTFEIVVSSMTIKIGDAKYGSLESALEAAKEGDVIVLGAGNYKGAYVINTNNVTIKSNAEEQADVKVYGTLTVAKNVKNVKFEDLYLTEGAQIITDKDGGQEAITVDGCTFDGCTTDASVGTVYFAGDVKDVVVKNCTFVNNRAGRPVRFQGTTVNFLLDNNTFNCGGGTWDWVLSQGTMKGIVTVTNNVFVKSQQAGVKFDKHGDGTFTIQDNEFYDMTSVAIDIRTSAGVACTSTFKIIHNIMDNSNVDPNGVWNPLRLRFNDYTEETLDATVNYNVYINWGTTYLEDASSCGLGWVNMDKNYFDGTASDALTAENFDSIAASWADAFTTLEALEAEYAIKKIDLDPNVLLVGESADYQKEKFATLAEALEAAVEGNVIYLLPGAHTGAVKLTKSNITITSLNGKLNPNSEDARNEEATFDSVITLSKELTNITISGIKFIGAAQILNEKGAAGSGAAPATNLNGFNFVNNIVESALTNAAKGFIYTVEASSGYSYNVNISNNAFTAATGFAAEAMLYIDNNHDLSLVGNTFKNITAKNVVYFHDTTKGLSGENSTLNQNVFENITGNALWVNWLSASPNGIKTAKVSVQANEFINVSGTAFFLGSMNNSDTYVAIDVKFNEFTKVGTGLDFNRVHAGANINCNYNIFFDVPTTYYIANEKTASANSVLNAKDNLFLKEGASITPDATKFKNADLIDYTTEMEAITDMPSFDSKAHAIEIVCPELFVGDEYQLTVKYIPENTQKVGVVWEVSDSTVATVDKNGVITCLKAGTVTLTATYVHNNEVTATYELTITDFREVAFDFESDGTLAVGEELQVKANIKGSSTTGTIVWSSSDDSVATVVDGKIKALKAGTAKITAKIEGTEIATSYTVTVSDLSDMDALLKLLVEGNNGLVWNRTINYIGYETGYTSSPNQVYNSVNNFWAGTLPEVTKNMLQQNAPNWDGRTMKSLEFITVHDTGAASPSSTALANSKWCTNSTNDGSSWHYTIGNDGIYQQIEDNMVAWHAGDGADWAETTTLYDTGIAADPNLRNRAVVTLNEDGYFYVNGQKSLVKMPEGATVSTGMNELGVAAVVKDGKYYIPTTWITKSYSNVVAIRGGNLNSIGIETAVNTGSDVYLTWQYTAKFVAQLLVKHNLTPERVLFHNSFANKTCPQTMMRSDNVEMFLDMVYLEYYVAKNYADYTITFTSNNPDVIDNEGRVVGSGPYKTTEVSYTITITKGTETKSATVYSVVQGSYKH